MREYMLIIRNEIDHRSAWSDDQHTQFLKKCELYIGNLKNEGKLLPARPHIREGKIISGKEGAREEKAFNETKEVQVGYYHILARNLDETIAIAKRNPEFEFGSTARIEVRPIKMKEETTGFVYPEMGISSEGTT